MVCEDISTDAVMRFDEPFADGSKCSNMRDDVCLGGRCIRGRSLRNLDILEVFTFLL